jgi:hypothetical protein
MQSFDRILQLFAAVSEATFYLLVVVMLIGQVVFYFTHSRPNGVFRKIIQYLGNFDIRKPDNKPNEYGVKKAEV